MTKNNNRDTQDKLLAFNSDITGTKKLPGCICCDSNRECQAIATMLNACLQH